MGDYLILYVLGVSASISQTADDETPTLDHLVLSTKLNETRLKGKEFRPKRTSGTNL